MEISFGLIAVLFFEGEEGGGVVNKSTMFTGKSSIMACPRVSTNS